MPPPSNLGVELSLRHLPDLSDGSFSFQIPTVAITSDLLLADDDNDFFQGVDDISTLGPTASRPVREPLSLSQLTPKPRGPYDPPQSQPMPLQPIFTTDASSSSKEKRIPQGISRVAKTRAAFSKATPKPSLKAIPQVTQIHIKQTFPETPRLETLRAEVEMLNNDKFYSGAGKQQVPTSFGKELECQPKKTQAISKTKSTVFAGGVTKVQGNRTSSTSRHMVSAPQGQSKPYVSAAEFTSLLEESKEQPNPDISVCSATSGGVAERLVMYSQRLINPYGLSSAEMLSEPGMSPEFLNPQRSEPIPDAVVASNSPDGIEKKSFTLSQLSPRKPASTSPTSTTISQINAPMSPMRPSSKRPVPAASTHPLHKKGKITTTAKLKLATYPPASHAATEVEVSVKNSGSESRVPTITARGAIRGTTHQGPAMKVEDNKAQGQFESQNIPVHGVLGDSPGSRSGPSASRSLRTDDTTTGNSVIGHVSVGSSKSGNKHMLQSVKRVVNSVVNPTKPIGFKFQLDERLEARKAELEKGKSVSTQKQKNHHPLPVPDFKTLHAVQGVELALRKENISPIVPLPIQLKTDSRAKERELFDERMKEKARELEKAIEQRRREKEEREVREVKELRKKTVPRAHEVPEWYKDAPKKKDRVADSILD